MCVCVWYCAGRSSQLTNAPNVDGITAMHEHCGIIFPLRNGGQSNLNARPHRLPQLDILAELESPAERGAHENFSERRRDMQPEADRFLHQPHIMARWVSITQIYLFWPT